jgi:hypothetical protein
MEFTHHPYGLLLQQFPAALIRPPFGHFSGEFVLTERRVLLNVKRSAFGLAGMIMSGLQLPSYRPFTAFDLSASEIKHFKKGVYGLNKNLVDLTDAKGNLHRFTVPNYDAFEKLLADWIQRNAANP